MEAQDSIDSKGSRASSLSQGSSRYRAEHASAYLQVGASAIIAPSDSAARTLLTSQAPAVHWFRGSTSGKTSCNFTRLHSAQQSEQGAPLDAAAFHCAVGNQTVILPCAGHHLLDRSRSRTGVI